MKANEKLLMAMSWIDEELIAEANDTKKPTRIGLKWISTIAASFIFIIGISLFLHLGFLGGNKAGGDSAPPPEFNGSQNGFEDRVDGTPSDKEEEDEEESKDDDE